MVVLTDVAPVIDKEYEVIDGHPEEKIMGGARQGGIGMRLGARLTLYVEENQLGAVYGPDTTFRIGRNQRLPDVAFVAASRIPPEGEPAGIWEIVPDLAVEIVSPNDFYEKVIAKVLEYLTAGVQQVWLISPENRLLTVYDSPTQTTILTEVDELTCDRLIPGFRCSLASIFRQPGRQTQ